MKYLECDSDMCKVHWGFVCPNCGNYKIGW